MSSESSSPSPLLIVTVLLRSKPGFESLHHVTDTLSTFLDSSVELSLAKASKFGSLKLLLRVLGSQSTWDPSDSCWAVRSLLSEFHHYQQYQFTLMLLEAVKQINYELIIWMFEHFRAFYVSREVVKEAAAAGNQDILEFFLDNDINARPAEEYTEEDLDRARAIGWGGTDAASAIRAGHADIAQWMYEAVYADDRDEHASMKAAVATGNVELMEWLQEEVGLYSEEGIQEAAANGHLAMVQWMYEQEFEDWSDRGTLVAAAEQGHLDLVRWLISRDREGEDYHNDSDVEEGDDSIHVAINSTRRPHITNVGGEATVAMHAAALAGHLEVAKYLYDCVDKPQTKNRRQRERERLDRTLEALRGQYERKFSTAHLAEESMLVAARRGLFDVVQWLHEEFGGNPKLDLFSVHDYGEGDRDFCAIDAAATEGHLKIVQFLHQVGKQAAIDALEWRKRKRDKRERESLTDSLYAVGYTNGVKPEKLVRPQGTTDAMDGAASNGHLEVVRWLHDNRSEGCTADAMDLAAKNGHLETVKWLHQHRKEGCTTEAMDGAAGGGRLDVVKWLQETRSEGCTTAAMDGAASGGHLAVVQWLHQHRSEGCTNAAIDGAAGCGALEVVKWLHENRSEGCSTAAMDKAAGIGDLRVLRWLHEHRSEGCTTAAMDNAAKGGHFEALLFLHKFRSEGCSRVAISMAINVPEIRTWVAEYYPNL